ncbi:MAG: hypothetical protein D3910_12895 [Candidatus Electrothrix sp. ATG2]|nr:hypothetical protein [Candidatus Electrothrix sp. ATG2]
MDFNIVTHPSLGQKPVREIDKFKRGYRTFIGEFRNVQNQLPAFKGAQLLFQIHRPFQGVKIKDFSLPAIHHAWNFFWSQTHASTNDDFVIFIFSRCGFNHLRLFVNANDFIHDKVDTLADKLAPGADNLFGLVHAKGNKDQAGLINMFIIFINDCDGPLIMTQPFAQIVCNHCSSPSQRR